MPNRIEPIATHSPRFLTSLHVLKQLHVLFTGDFFFETASLRPKTPGLGFGLGLAIVISSITLAVEGAAFSLSEVVKLLATDARLCDVDRFLVIFVEVAGVSRTRTFRNVRSLHLSTTFSTTTQSINQSISHRKMFIRSALR